MAEGSQMIAKMRAVYAEFGIDIHSVPANLQPQLNRLVRALIKARERK